VLMHACAAARLHQVGKLVLVLMIIDSGNLPAACCIPFLQVLIIICIPYPDLILLFSLSMVHLFTRATFDYLCHIIPVHVLCSYNR